MLDGPAHRADGHNPQLGTIRGPYKVGGLSLRTIQEKKKKLRDKAAASNGLISQEELAKQLEAIDQQAKQGSSSKQTSLNTFFKRSRADAPSPSPPPSPKRLHTDVDHFEIPELILDCSEVEIISSDDEEIIAEGLIEGEELIDAAQEWVEILDEDMPKVIEDFHTLSLENLRKARKSKDYESELWFAALSDFYQWTPCQGQISASQRGKHVTGGLLIDDEDTYMGIQ